MLEKRREASIRGASCALCFPIFQSTAAVQNFVATLKSTSNAVTVDFVSSYALL